ncbi:MAG: CHAT domain-containing protein, partial [Nodosilinea sp.]
SEADALNNLGLAALDSGQLASATDYFIDAIGVYESLRIADLPDADRISIFDTYLRSYLLLQRSLVTQNETERALVYAEQGRARAFVELLSTRITNNGNLDVASLESINSLNLSQIQRVAREQNATLVNYSVISDKALFIWVVQPTGEIAFQQVDLGDRNLTELVGLVRSAIGVRGQDRATVAIEPTPDALERQQARRQQQLQQLHQLLIEPITPSLPTDPNQRVIFIPHQDLFLVPFAALVDGNGDYLIENHTILTAPSIQVLDLTYQQAIANNARSDRPTNSLIVGNPIMPSVWNPQTNQTAQLSTLPGAEREAIAIAEVLDTEALLSGSASKAAVVAQMPNARLIHLATHGLLEYGTPEDSGVLDVPGAIALAPSASESGLLTAAEILQMNLNAELVVLSACDTGRGRITGDGVIGLSRAFVTAGVPSLMVSLWAVDDDATAEWMVTFYDQWQQTGDKAQAARQAMLTTMENHPDPRLWAAFTLIGSAE